MQLLSENPLAKLTLQVDEADAEDEAEMETKVLEAAVTKIINLLAVGFGDAGAEIIAENMRTTGALNPMVPGKRTVRGARVWGTTRCQHLVLYYPKWSRLEPGFGLH